MLDFPASPVLNQQFSAANSSWVWDGTAWNIVPQMVPAVASDTPPANPAVGQFWWRASNGQLYLWYVDPSGPPGQWVQAAASADVIGEPYPFKTANMRLSSKSATQVALNSKADGSGTDIATFNNAGSLLLSGAGIAYTANSNNNIGFKWTGSFLQAVIDSSVQGNLWSGSNVAFTQLSPGLLSLPNGFVLQWGLYSGNAADIIFNFPNAFPTACAIVVATPYGAPAANVSWTVTVDQVSRTGFAYRPRYIQTGGTVAAGIIPVTWLAVGW